MSAAKDIDRIADIGVSAQSAWYRDLKRLPPLLANSDLRAILGVGRTQAWTLMRELGALKVGGRLKLDRNALIAYLVSCGLAEEEVKNE